MRQTAIRQLSVRLLLLLTTVLAVFLLIGGAADAEQQVVTVEYVVQAGDTLWDIASQHVSAGSDVRNLVGEIRQLSQLNGSVIHPGQILQLPTG